MTEVLHSRSFSAFHLASLSSNPGQVKRGERFWPCNSPWVVIEHGKIQFSTTKITLISVTRKFKLFGAHIKVLKYFTWLQLFRYVATD